MMMINAARHHHRAHQLSSVDFISNRSRSVNYLTNLAMNIIDTLLLFHHLLIDNMMMTLQ